MENTISKLVFGCLISRNKNNENERKSNKLVRGVYKRDKEKEVKLAFLSLEE